jgi:WNK lysine deficient protein kinase
MDIYSFGMCVLAMVTGAEPYCECDEREIEQRAASGDLPLGLRRIENPLCVEFIESCLRLNPQERLSVEQLCDHPFLQPSEESDDKVVTLGMLLFPSALIH